MSSGGTRQNATQAAGAGPAPAPLPVVPEHVERGLAKGRISFLVKNPEVGKKIATLIATVGCTSKDACREVGIAEKTYLAWLAKGREEGARREYRDFAELISKAETRRRILHLGNISRAAQKPQHWQAAAWMLTHTDPEHFTPNIRIHITQEYEAAFERLSAEFVNEPEILARAIAALAGAAAKPAGDGVRANAGGEEASGAVEAQGRGVADPSPT